MLAAARRIPLLLLLLPVLIGLPTPPTSAGELLDWKPMPMPRRELPPGEDPATPPGNVVSYDVATGETVYRLASTAPTVVGDRGFLTGRQGESPTLLDPRREGPQGNFSPYTPTPDPSAFPYSTHVRLAMTFVTTAGDTVRLMCSGTLIDPRHVLTAGHCVYAHEPDEGGQVYQVHDWAVKVEVVPAYDRGHKPFGNAEAVEYHSWSGWVDSEDHDHDVALIDLDRPVGYLTGWRGYGYDNDCDYFTNGNWAHHVYPADDGYDSHTMQTNTGDFDGCDDVWGAWYGNEVWARRPGIGGTSGGGAVRNDIVWAVRSNTSWGGLTGYDSFDCRITSGKFRDIESYIEQDRGEFWELIPLDVRSPDSSLAAGDYLQVFDVGVANHAGGTFASTLQMNAYLSLDPIISPSDILLGSYAGYREIGPLGFQRVLLPGWRIPPGTPSGRYYLGVIVTVPDEDESNNATLPVDTDTLWVDCPPIGEPRLTSPADDSTCVPSATTLAWAGMSNASRYQVQIDNRCPPATGVSVTSNSYLDVSDLDPGQGYYWRVRAENSCQPGTYGPWSPCNRFVVESAAPDTISLVTPLEGSTCEGTGVVFDWERATNTMFYHLQVGTSCGSGTIHPVERGRGSDLTVNGLLYGTTYHWRVRGRNGCGVNGPWSECRTFTTAGSPLGAPGGAAPVDGATCVSPTAGLSWNAVAGADSFLVRYGSSGCFADADTAFVVPGTSAPFPEALPNMTYWWSVQAFDDCGQLGVSTPCLDFTLAGAGPEPPTTSMEPGTARSCDNADVLLTWGKVFGATEYQLRFAAVCGPSMPSYTTTNRWYAFTGLPAGEFFWQVRAKNSCGTWGHWSPCKSFVVDTGVPGIVSGLGSTSHSPGAWSNQPAIAFSWRTPRDPLGEDCGTPRYSILADESPATLPDLDPDLSATEHTTPALADGGDHWFHVRIIDEGGNASPDAVHVGPYRIDTAAPSATLLAPNGGESWTAGTQQTIRWLASDALSGVERSELRYSTDSGQTYTAIATLAPETDTYDWTVPDVPGATVLVEVAVADSAGSITTDRSDGTFAIVSQVGVGDPSDPLATRLLASRPNPFHSSTTVTFSLAEEGPVSLTVFDTRGRQVRRLATGDLGAGLHHLVWDGTSDSGRPQGSGVYLLRLETRQGAHLGRLLLMR